MTTTSLRAAPPAEPTISEAARRMAEAGRPLGLGAWREVMRSGALPGDPDPDATAAGLVRRWHQHLAVVIDLPMERWAPGADRLPQLLTEWLDLARRTAPVREHVAAHGGARTQAEQARQRALLARLLAEDLDALGAPSPQRSAADLVQQLEQVAAAEDAAGRPLAEARRTLVGSTGAVPPARQRTGLLDRLVHRLRPAAL